MGYTMIKFRVVCAGNIKEQYLKEAITEYSKRINKYAKIEIIECHEEKLSPNPNAAEIDKVLETEADSIIKNLAGFSILCDIDAKEFSSPELAEFIKAKTLENSTITFVIGSSYGVSNRVRNSVNARVSFSKCTFPHMLMRVILLEQIYRSLAIINNATYHK